MSFPDPPPPFMTHSAFSGGDAIGVWPPIPISNEQSNPYPQFEYPAPPPSKRPRNFEDQQSNPMPYPPMNPNVQPPNPPPVNKGTSIFFKTRMCTKFRLGTCRNGENCNFAHGSEDLRLPPPNWEELVGRRGEAVGRRGEVRVNGDWDEDQKIIHRMKLCKKFCSGEECPYGERCNFFHEDPKKYRDRDDSAKFRESSAISIGTTGSLLGHGIRPDQPEINKGFTSGFDAIRMNEKPVYWKTKLCIKWEMGQCPFGEKCHFAHGPAELQLPAVRTEGELGTAIPIKPFPIVSNDATPTLSVVAEQEESGRKSLLKWKGPKKINRIYADWIDDLPSLSNTVET